MNQSKGRYSMNLGGNGNKGKKRWFSISLLLVLVLVVVEPAQVSPLSRTYAQHAFAQEESHTFPETGKTLSGKFLQYWRTHGGLVQQGYPISDELQELSDTDGKTYIVQ